MPLPRNSNAYPLEFREALIQAISKGELFIPNEKPSFLRLQLYGYTSALRREDTPELADACSFFISKTPPGLWIRLKEKTESAKSIRAAIDLAGVGNTTQIPPELNDDDSEIDRLFNRIIKG
jgi:hypothetical protein